MVTCDLPPTSVDVFAAFVIAIVLMAATPGPAMALILQRAGSQGFRQTIPTVLGIEVGLLFWAVAGGTGMAALVAASEVAFLGVEDRRSRTASLSRYPSDSPRTTGSSGRCGGNGAQQQRNAGLPVCIWNATC